MKIALIGYGKMGKEIERIARSRGHEVVCIVDINNQEELGGEAFRSADVAIEFTSPATAYGNCLKAFEAGVKVVSGSTGWMGEHGEEMQRLCREQGKTLFWSSNFSLGVTIFRAVNRYLAKIMNQFDNYSATLEEVHHIHKLDHPSGTGITLGEELVAEVDRLSGWEFGMLTNPDGSTEGTADVPADKLRIDSIRRDEVPGIHSITWNSEADQITITHDAHSRLGFAFGAVLAAEYTAKHNGLLTMSDLFKF